MGMDITGKSGNYFRANLWSWRPIHALVEELNQEHSLGLDLDYWGSNDGAGLDNQKDCDALADAIESHVQQGRRRYVLEVPGAPRVSEKGTFCAPGEPGTSPYETSAKHLLEFVTFLRGCGGGFEIW